MLLYNINIRARCFTSGRYSTELTIKNNKKIYALVMLGKEGLKTLISAPCCCIGRLLLRLISESDVWYGEGRQKLNAVGVL